MHRPPLVWSLHSVAVCGVFILEQCGVFIPEQCVESSLQEKMTSPQPTSIVAVKQEPGDEVLKEEKVDLGKCLVSLRS